MKAVLVLLIAPGIIQFACSELIQCICSSNTCGSPDCYGTYCAIVEVRLLNGSVTYLQSCTEQPLEEQDIFPLSAPSQNEITSVLTCDTVNCNTIYSQFKYFQKNPPTQGIKAYRTFEYPKQKLNDNMTAYKWNTSEILFIIFIAVWIFILLVLVVLNSVLLRNVQKMLKMNQILAARLEQVLDVGGGNQPAGNAVIEIGNSSARKRDPFFVKP
ncbi:hypothetical protein L596_013408 [Steinernema carpocapsae]|uniref:Uncharacterized protein n=1 Tax=Steinernema carpocapsae TaxID=34508 RepID=A0A4U5P017_STECR|nr:hypothetical protein L596_013408 [Steinernema carpocapsae]